MLTDTVASLHKKTDEMIRTFFILNIAIIVSLARGAAEDVPPGGKPNGPDAVDIVTSDELSKVVSQLEDPSTERAALRKLIKFSGVFLYEGSVSYVTGDRNNDELRRSAARAIGSHRTLDSVRRALDDNDTGVRFWGVMSFEFTFGNKGPWEPLLPRLEEIASHDQYANIRSEAISKLEYYDEAAAFLTTLRESTSETDPSVLMTLLRFYDLKPELRAHWYARAVECLSGKDEALRLQWMSYIFFNVWNPSTAPMWRIDADPALVATLRQAELEGSPKDKDLAGKIMEAFARRHE
jgi:hypothetical protein